MSGGMSNILLVDMDQRSITGCHIISALGRGSALTPLAIVDISEKKSVVNNFLKARIEKKFEIEAIPVMEIIKCGQENRRERRKRERKNKCK